MYTTRAGSGALGTGTAYLATRGDWLMPFIAPPEIEAMEAHHDLEGLIAALGNEADIGMCYGAAYALGRLKDPRAVELLIEALSKGSELQRSFAAFALGEIGDPIAIESLIEALADPAGDIHWNAADALVHIGSPAVEPLLAALRNRHQWMVRWTLDQMGWQPTLDESGAAYWITRGEAAKCAPIGAAAVEQLLEVLDDDAWYVRQHAAEALGEIGDPHAIQPLIEVLDDSEQLVCNAAADALVKLGSPAVDALCAALRHSRDAVQRAAAGVLADIGDARAVVPIISLLQDEDPRLVNSAATALGKLRDPRAVQPLLDILENPRSPGRTASAEALAEIGDEHAVVPLIAALCDENEVIRWTAATALGSLCDARGAQPLLDALNDPNQWVRFSAASSLMQLYAAGRLEREHKSILLDRLAR